LFALDLKPAHGTGGLGYCAADCLLLILNWWTTGEQPLQAANVD